MRKRCLFSIFVLGTGLTGSPTLAMVAADPYGSRAGSVPPAPAMESRSQAPASPFAVRQQAKTGGAGSVLRLAHAILVRSVPQKEQTIDAAPERIELWFNEGVGPKYTSVAVVDSDGQRVDNNDGALDFSDRSHLTATLKTLSPGRYGVRYRVQSADGHIVTGKYFFTVGQ